MKISNMPAVIRWVRRKPGLPIYSNWQLFPARSGTEEEEEEEGDRGR